MTVPERLSALRQEMRAQDLSLYLIPTSDFHGSEYVGDYFKCRSYISGFTGSAGTLLVGLDSAGLWTDGRYFLQAGQQLSGSGITLFKMEEPGVPKLMDYIVQQLPQGGRLGFDGRTLDTGFVRKLEQRLAKKGGVFCPELDLAGAVWPDRPSLSCRPAWELDLTYAGESRQDKLTRVRSAMEQAGAQQLLVTALDEIAWLLNVRGSDVEYNPVVLSYLLVTQDNAEWFVRKSKTVDDETYDSFDELMKDGVEIKYYDDICISLSEYACSGARLYADTSSLNYHLYKVLKDVGDNFSMVTGASPVPLYKAVKNVTEIEGMREAHVEDGVVMEKFLWWLDCCMKDGIELSEWDAARYLGSLRAEIQGYRGDSFQTISAYGPSAALPHYVTPESGGMMLEPHGLYLCDSGGQYLFGTTDITRTVPLGPCDGLEMEDYTLVLKGHIGLAMSVFPAGTAGCQIDYAARSPLWQARRNFGHGTGHGVGFFLNVHEGPQDIRQNLNPQPLVPGMITSDEPGLYREGLHGIRHESLLLCKDAGVNEFASWLCFEPLTLCHIDTSAVIADLLTSDERDWLNAYNERVWQNLSPLLPEEVALWLRTKTLPI